MSVAAVGVFNNFSVHIISLCAAFLALVSVFVYIPFVSGFAFWFMLAAYIGLAGHREGHLRCRLPWPPPPPLNGPLRALSRQGARSRDKLDRVADALSAGLDT